MSRQTLSVPCGAPDAGLPTNGTQTNTETCLSGEACSCYHLWSQDSTGMLHSVSRNLLGLAFVFAGFDLKNKCLWEGEKDDEKDEPRRPKGFCVIQWEGEEIELKEKPVYWTWHLGRVALDVFLLLSNNTQDNRPKLWIQGLGKRFKSWLIPARGNCFALSQLPSARKEKKIL